MSFGFNTSWQRLPWAESSQLLNDSWMRNYNIYDADTSTRMSSLAYFAQYFPSLKNEIKTPLEILNMLFPFKVLFP